MPKNASQHHKAEATLRKRVQELEALNRLSQKAGTYLDIQKMVDASLEEIYSIIHPDLALLFMREGEILHLRGYHRSRQQIHFEESGPHRVGQCLCGIAVEQEKPVYSLDIITDSRCTWEECKRAGLLSFAALPLRSRDETIGLLALASRRKTDFGESASFLETMAAEVAVALHNAILYEKVKGHGEALAVMNRDLRDQIAERRKAEEALRESEKKLRLLSDVAFDGISVTENGLFLEVNREFADIFGYVPSEITGQPVSKLIAPAWRRDVAQKISDGYDRPYESMGLRKDGNRVPLEVYGKSFQSGSRSLRITAVRNIAERKKLESQLMHAQKLEAVGQLAGGVSHEFNNILTAIINNVYLLLGKTPEGDPAKHNLEKILKVAGNGAVIARELLSFSRKQPVDLSPIKLNDAVRDAERLLKIFMGENIDTVLGLSEREPVIMADRSQIEQVLVNLATNARDAMPVGGTLTIETDIREIDAQFAESAGFSAPGTYALLTVSDTGTGIDEDTQKKIFEPFFTTKEVGKGTGLGLSIIYGIIKQHNGHVTVKSHPEQGTVFRIFFPLLSFPARKEKAALPDAARGRAETILLAEDEADVRESIKNLLEDSGYRVIEADNGREAIEKFIKHKDSIALLILDVIMPGISGKEAFTEIRKISPDAKAIFASGYSSDHVHNREILENKLVFISKPLSPEKFLAKIRDVLKS